MNIFLFCFIFYLPHESQIRKLNLKHFKCCISQSQLDSTAKIELARNQRITIVENLHKSIANMTCIQTIVNISEAKINMKKT